MRLNRLLRVLFVLLIGTGSVSADEAPLVVPLWPDGAPGFEDRRDERERTEGDRVSNIHQPSLSVFLPVPEDATGAGVIICPGGGHRELAFDAEGREPAEFLQKLGVTAFVLKYRLAREPNSPYNIEEHARQDAQRAIRVVRSRASEWYVDPRRVGMLGFSAGGEVVSLVAYEKGEGDRDAEDPVERESAAVNYQLLVYPGPIGVPETVGEDAPPTFLVAANDDRDPARTVVDLLDKYRAAGAPIEIHLYARGGHGFNMGRRAELVSIHKWPQRMADWMADNYVLEPAPRRRGTRGEGDQQRERGRRRDRSTREVTVNRQPVDPTGTWLWETTFGDSVMAHTLVLALKEGTLSGTYAARFDSPTSPEPEPAPLEKASFENNQVSFAVTRRWNDREFTVRFEGEVSDNEIEGVSAIDFGEGLREFDWLAERARDEHTRPESTREE
jgi:acetyl esterase/lipase